MGSPPTGELIACSAHFLFQSQAIKRVTNRQGIPKARLATRALPEMHVAAGTAATELLLDGR